MDKDELIRHLDRTLRIRAMFAFEETSSTIQEEEQVFLQEAIDLVRRQPVAAEALGAPSSLLGACLGDC